MRKPIVEGGSASLCPFALVAAFDLDLRQRDAVTAFLNSKLDDKETYTYIFVRNGSKISSYADTSLQF
jgi:ABC-type phosphate/phosphonate transport system substrate-binding protein